MPLYLWLWLIWQDCLENIFDMKTSQEPVLYPDAPEYLRCQVREMRTREASYPIFDSNEHIVRHGTADEYKANKENNGGDETSTPNRVGYFQLIGFGSTWKAAKEMANKYA